MQELSAIVPAREKQTIIKTAISKVDAISITVRESFLMIVSSINYWAVDAPLLMSWQFRAAIQLQFDFHRAIYNLGTVLV